MDYDLIVLGTGGIGSAAMHSAAERGLRCLGLDRFSPAHDRGSSHGESRLIRLSYFEHHAYVPLLRRSYALWDALDPALLHRSGVLYQGKKGGKIMRGLLASALKHNLDLQTVDSDAYPQYLPADNTEAMFESQAGWLPVEQCVQRHLDAAIAAGADHRWGEAVMQWQAEPGGVSVQTASCHFRASALVIAGGPWAGDLLSDLSLPLHVERKHMHWFACDDERYRHGFFYELPHGQFYGFPMANGRLKLAEHSGGETVEDPLTASGDPCPVDEQRIADFVKNYLPGVHSERLAHKSCFYTRTPDDHFIVDRHPNFPQVAFAAGLSGHGFKFAPALGEVLVDFATQREASVDVSFLSLDRF